jgi:rhamnogalacturonyl hydrolase YesR
MNSQFLIEKYLLKESLSTFDPYDIWITKTGQKVKQFYYGHNLIGIVPAGLLTVYDFYINNTLRLGYKKREYPLLRAQAALTLLSLYSVDAKREYLLYAKKHLDWLLKNASKGYSGYCWGLNYDWVYSADEIYDDNMPFSTHTPYPLEAMVKYYEITQDETLLEPIKSVFDFFETDIKVMKESDEILALSYGVHKDRIATNATSYAMYCYALLLEFLPDKKEYIEKKIEKLYNFLCSVQKSDGSWLYSPYDDNTFIDTFHSAFIMKNILKTNEILELKDSGEIVNRGYYYVKENMLVKEKNLFKRFSKTNRVSIIKFDLYDNAEMLNLANMLDDKKMITDLTLAIEENFMTSEGEVASVIDMFGGLKNINHMGWAVVQYLYALSKIKEHKSCVEF